MLYKKVWYSHLRDIDAILTHSFQISMDDFLAMEILNAICDIKRLDKATMTNEIPGYYGTFLPKKHNRWHLCRKPYDSGEPRILLRSRVPSMETQGKIGFPKCPPKSGYRRMVEHWDVTAAAMS